MYVFHLYGYATKMIQRNFDTISIEDDEKIFRVCERKREIEYTKTKLVIFKTKKKEISRNVFNELIGLPNSRGFASICHFIVCAFTLIRKIFVKMFRTVII